ncbi:MFS transporter [Novosphingobium sp.]|uniref:MFS transporter n=1 Tax=Novosphingobium sp. TaxID=1874826 RepID=UPI0033404AF2
MPARPRRDAWICLGLVGAMQCLAMLDRNILAILNPRIKADLHIGDAEMGLLYGTVFALFYAVFSLPLGRLADGWRRGWLLAICIVLWSLATGMAGFASGFAMLAISRLGVGIGEAAVQPAGTSLVFDCFPKSRRGLALAVMGAMLAAGLGLSSVLGGMAADGWDHAFGPGHLAPLGLKGWQFAFVLAALPGVPLAILLALMREPVRGQSDGIVSRVDPAPFRASLAVLVAVLPLGVWWTLARAKAGSRVIARNALALVAISVVMVALAHFCAGLSPRPPLHLLGLTIDPHALQWTIVGIGGYVVVNFLQSLRLADAPTHAVIMGSPALWLCLFVGALQTTINYGVMGFTPAFLMKTWHLSAGDVGLKFGLLSAAIGMIGPMISGPLSDWLAARHGAGGRVMLVALSLGVSPFVAMAVYTSPDPATFYLRFTLYSVILTMWLPPLYAVLYEQVLPRMRGQTAALYILLMTILGLGIGPYWVGMVADRTHGNLGTAILSVNGLSPVIVIALLALWRRADRDAAGALGRACAAGELV